MSFSSQSKAPPQSLKFFEWSLVPTPDLLSLQNTFHISPAWPPLYSEPMSSPTCMLVYVLSRFSRVHLFVTPWTVARQAPLSMGFSRQEHWRGLPCPPPGDPPDPGIKLVSPASQADSLPRSQWGSPLQLTWPYRFFLLCWVKFFSLITGETGWSLRSLNKQTLEVSHPGAHWNESWENQWCCKPPPTMANVFVTFHFWLTLEQPFYFLWILLDMTCLSWSSRQVGPAGSASAEDGCWPDLWGLPKAPWGFPGGSLKKNPPAMQEMRVRSLSQEDALEEGVVTHSSVLARKITWTEEPGGLQCVRLQRVEHEWSN